MRDQRRAEFLSRSEEFEQRVEALAYAIRRRMRLDPVQLEALTELMEYLRAHGLRVATLLPPVTVPATYAGWDDVLGDVHLEFNDPATFPEYFRLSHRYDDDHLNARGARTWSRELADLLLENFEYRERSVGEDQ